MSNDKDNDIEMLDFNESPEENVEMLDFESNVNDLSKTEVISLTDINNNSDSKLSSYEPNIKDFNIKSEKTRKIVKKSMLY